MRQTSSAMISVGDVLAVIDLIDKLVSLLKGSIYSPTEFRQLLNDLNSLSSALVNCYRLLSEPNALPLEPMTCNDINTALLRCESLINDFVGMFKSKGYYDSFKQGGSGHLWLDWWRKLRWAHSMPEKIDSLKRTLLEQQMVVNTIVSISNCDALGRVQHNAQHNTELQLRHYNKLETIHVGIQQLQQLPRSLGYTWEGSDTTPVWFIDMRDVKIRFPMELCENWELFEGILKLYFKDKVGQSYVERGDYDLTDGGSDQVILPATWNSDIRAGVTINMNAILRLKGSDQRRCPSCRKSPPSVTQNGGKTTCSFCHTIYRVSDSFIEEVETEQDSWTSHGCGSSALTLSQKGSTMDDETILLRRFHIILTTVIPTNTSTPRPRALPTEVVSEIASEMDESHEGSDAPFIPAHRLDTAVTADGTDNPRSSFTSSQLSPTQNSSPSQLSGRRPLPSIRQLHPYLPPGKPYKSPIPTNHDWEEVDTETEEDRDDNEEDADSARGERGRSKATSLFTAPTPTNHLPPRRKGSGSKLFAPFQLFAATKRISAASMEAIVAGTEDDPVVSPQRETEQTQTTAQPFPACDPYAVTQEWRGKEEAELLGRTRRRRPGVVFDLPDEPSEDKKRLRPVRSRVSGPLRSR